MIILSVERPFLNPARLYTCRGCHAGTGALAHYLRHHTAWAAARLRIDMHEQTVGFVRAWLNVRYCAGAAERSAHTSGKIE
jgi:hypothetical protein